MRCVLACLLVLATMLPAAAQQCGLLDQGFDPTRLSRAELRYLLGALAFDGFYTGALDGAWGRGGAGALARALDRVDPTFYDAAEASQRLAAGD